MLSDVCLSDVCLYAAYIEPKSRTERPRKIKIGTEVARVLSRHLLGGGKLPPKPRNFPPPKNFWPALISYTIVCTNIFIIFIQSTIF